MFTPNPATPYTPQTFPFTEAMARLEEPARALYNADNANLAPFAAHGGRLILYHGWADPHISPLGTIDYFERVGAKMGASNRDAFTRLFLLPGMGHCSGGDGPSEFPLLANLMAWVENGDAPQVMVAHRASPKRDGQPMGGDGPRRGSPADGQMPPMMGPGGPGGPDGPDGAMGPPPGMVPSQPVLAPRSRPIYAYPQVAVYKGTGSVDDAASFTAATPEHRNGIAQWVGAQ